MGNIRIHVAGNTGLSAATTGNTIVVQLNVAHLLTHVDVQGNVTVQLSRDEWELLSGAMA